MGNRAVFFWICTGFLSLSIFSGCYFDPQAAEEPFASIPTDPTPLYLPTNTFWDGSGSNSEGTGLFPDLEVISVHNVNQIQEIARWGKGDIKGIALSPDGSTIAVSTKTGIYLYNRKTLSETGFIDIGVETDEERQYWCRGSRNNIDFSQDGRFLAIGENDLYVWDLVENRISKLFRHPLFRPKSFITEVLFSRENNNLAVTRIDTTEYPCVSSGSLVIYNTDVGIPISTYKLLKSDTHPRLRHGLDNTFFVDHRGDYLEFDYASGELLSENDEKKFNQANSSVIASRTEGNDWQISSSFDNHECLFSVHGRDSWYPQLVESSSDATIAITFSESRSTDLLIWNFVDCEKSTRHLFFPEPSRHINFTPSGNLLITGSAGGHFMYVWDVKQGSPLFPIRAEGLVYSIQDEKSLAIVEGDFRELDLMDPKTGDIIFSNVIGVGGGSVDWNVSLQNPNVFSVGNYLVDTSNEPISVKKFGEENLFISPNGEFIASVSERRDGPSDQIFIDIWNVETGDPIETKGLFCPNKCNLFTHFSNFSPQWTYLASGNNENVIIWNIQTQKVVSHIDTPIDSQVMFSSDGKILFTRYFGTQSIKIWDVESGQLIKNIFAPLKVWESPSIAISPDGKLLVFIANDGTVRVWGIE